MRKLTVAILPFLLIACGKLNEVTAPNGPGNGEPVDPTATLTRIQSEIFTPTCAVLGCHDTIGRQSEQILSNGRSYEQLVNKPSIEIASLMRVKPGDPANSYLYRKLTGSGITGDRMPQFGTPLSDTQLKLVRDWIRRGAPND